MKRTIFWTYRPLTMVRGCSLVLALAAIASCGAKAASESRNQSGLTCPSDTVACSGAGPSYAQDVAPIVAERCLHCHVVGGDRSDLQLDTRARLAQHKDGVIEQIAGCQMPPSDQTQLSDAERRTILEWLVCGARDN